jgi:hypothetical protein
MPCQDFADGFTTVNQDKAFIVVSDGCSSGGQTDLGARFLSRRLYAQMQQLLKSSEADLTHSIAQQVCVEDLEMFALETHDLTATLLYAVADQKGISMHMYGDGVMVVLLSDGSIVMRKAEWQKNTPYYPIYGSKLGREVGLYEKFLEVHRECEFPYEVTTLSIQGDSMDIQHSFHGIDYGMSGIHSFVCLDPADSVRPCAVGIFTDGVGQVIRDLGSIETKDWTSVILDCVRIRNPAGAFLKRRVRRAMQQWSSQEFFPQDDLSGAMIWLDYPTISIDQP